MNFQKRKENTVLSVVLTGTTKSRMKNPRNFRFPSTCVWQGLEGHSELGRLVAGSTSKQPEVVDSKNTVDGFVFDL